MAAEKTALKTVHSDWKRCKTNRKVWPKEKAILLCQEGKGFLLAQEKGMRNEKVMGGGEGEGRCYVAANAGY
jgi:hypothetical protein